MPCEGCHVQFTVFKRKRSCHDCKRYYCHNCLANSSNINRKYALCERCVLFSKRPLARSDLIKLKPKDLIFYLQSKHISTAGCVEKEELIDLVLQYVNRVDLNNQTFSGGSGSSSSSSSHQTTPQHQNSGGGGAGAGTDSGEGNQQRRSTDFGPGGNNSFDSLKQTCQNFFSNLSDNISDSLANLEGRACSKNRPTNNMSASTASSNVTEQPRIATRAIPTYASSQQNSPENPIISPVGGRTLSANPNYNKEALVVNLPPPQEAENKYENNDAHEECNCSDDDEIIANFNERTRSPRSELQSPNLARTENNNNMDINSSTPTSTHNCPPSTSTGTSKAPSQYSKLEIYVNDEEESSHSSFEELGAIGGISDDSKTTTDTTSNTTDHWQILDLKTSEAEIFSSAIPQQQQTQHQEVFDSSHELSQDSLQNIFKTKTNNCAESKVSIQPPPTPTHVHPTPRVKKVTRRRSESYLNRRRHQTSVDDDEDDSTAIAQNPQNRIDEEIQTSSTSVSRKSTTKRCCSRCGKNKANIRQQVEKMRQHLESSQMSEADIKQELSEFLIYLEQRTKSVEYSDSDAGISSASASRNAIELEEEEEIALVRQLSRQIESEQTNGNTTGANLAENVVTQIYDKDSRFINLDEIESM